MTESATDSGAFSRMGMHLFPVTFEGFLQVTLAADYCLVSCINNAIFVSVFESITEFVQFCLDCCGELTIGMVAVCAGSNTCRRGNAMVDFKLSLDPVPGV
jgi:hypothetical protein